MVSQSALPDTLLEAVAYFSDLNEAHEFFAAIRWPNGPTCPSETCASTDVYLLSTRKVYKCRSCKKQFSVKVGTIFEDSPISLQKWLPVVWLLANCKNGISSYEIARDIKVTQKSAWFMLQRVRAAMHAGSFDKKLCGEIEVDETYIGGDARNMHPDRKKRVMQGKGGGFSHKIGVQGILQRGGEIRVTVVNDSKLTTLVPNVNKHVEKGSEVFTDELKSYFGLQADFIHRVINHAEKYVDGRVHTNGIENFWSLLKRCLGGTYISVEPWHLFRYLDEQVFRYNNRREFSDLERFVKVLDNATGRRLTYQHLTGKDKLLDRSSSQQPLA